LHILCTLFQFSSELFYKSNCNPSPIEPIPQRETILVCTSHPIFMFTLSQISLSCLDLYYLLFHLNTLTSPQQSTLDKCLVGSKNLGVSMSGTYLHPTDFQVQLKTFSRALLINSHSSYKCRKCTSSLWLIVVFGTF